MKRLSKWLGLAVAVVAMSNVATAQVVLYSNDLESATPAAGTSDSGLFEFHGLGSLIFADEVCPACGVGGSQAYTQGWDGTVSSLDGFYFIGGGEFAVFADDGNPLPSSDPADYTFYIDVKVTGNSIPTPVPFTVYQFNDNYDTEQGEDGNGDTVVNGAENWNSTLAPVLVDGAGYVTSSYTLDSGAIGADSGVTTPTFDPTVSLQWRFAFGAGEFGFDGGNSLHIDNIRLEVVPEPASMALLGVGGLMMMLRRRA